MKKTYSIPEFIVWLINTTMIILIFYNTFFYSEIWQNHIWALTFGLWGGWNNRRNYYKYKIEKCSLTRK